MKTPFSQILKEHARKTQPDFDPALHERIMGAVQNAARKPRRHPHGAWRLPGLAIALAACVVLALTFPLMFQKHPRPAPNPPGSIQAELPTPKSLLALNLDPADKQALSEIDPDVAEPIASLDRIPGFFQAQFDLLMGE